MHREPTTEPRNRWAALRTQPTATPVTPLVVGQSAPAPATPDRVRLAAEPRALLERLSRLAPAVAITKNAAAALESRLDYASLRRDADGTARSAGVQLEIRRERWSEAFVLRRDAGARPTRTLVVKADDGTVVHEAMVEGAEAVAAFDAAFADLVCENQTPAAPSRGRRSTGDDRRLDTLRFGDVARAWRVDTGSFEYVLEAAACAGAAVRVSVSNAGTRQHWSGVVQTAPRGRWMVALDQGVRLQVRGDRIAQVWVARRPTFPGSMTTIELFDTDGELVLVLSPGGDADDRRWLALLDELVPQR